MGFSLELGKVDSHSPRVPEDFTHQGSKFGGPVPTPLYYFPYRIR